MPLPALTPVARHGRNVPYGVALIAMSASWLVFGHVAPIALAPLAWATASFCVVGLGYMGLGPAVLGKRSDGTMSVARVALLFPFFLASHVLFALHRVFRRGRPVDHVGAGLYVSARLTAGELPPEITVVVDLTAELAEPRAIVDRTRYLLLPTLDGCPPELTERSRELLETLTEMHDERILVHCAFGHGRSAAVAAAVLVSRGFVMSAADAEAMMRVARPAIRMTSAQRAWVMAITRSRREPCFSDELDG